MLLLASASPRRRELLKLINPEFKVVSGREVNEVYPSDLSPEEVPMYLSGLKADGYRMDINEGDILITADTVVILDNNILGKPVDCEDAINMLKRLSGRTHVVVTGVTLTSRNKTVTFSNRTEVDFDNLSDSEIEHYVKEYRPFDKAGAYGIQEWIGAAAIVGIRGCFYNVMGLPVHELYRQLKNF